MKKRDATGYIGASFGAIGPHGKTVPKSWRSPVGRDRKRHRESPHISAEEQGMVAMLPALRSGSTDVRSNHAVFEGESGELRGGASEAHVPSTGGMASDDRSVGEDAFRPAVRSTADARRGTTDAPGAERLRHVIAIGGEDAAGTHGLTSNIIQGNDPVRIGCGTRRHLGTPSKSMARAAPTCPRPFGLCP